MRNIDRIRQMSLEELAPYFVKDETFEFNSPCFTSPSGDEFWTEEDAIDDCIRWLNKEYYDEDLQVYCTECLFLSEYDDGSPKCCFGEMRFGKTCDLDNYKKGKPYKQRTHYRKRKEK